MWIAWLEKPTAYLCIVWLHGCQLYLVNWGQSWQSGSYVKPNRNKKAKKFLQSTHADPKPSYDSAASSQFLDKWRDA